MARIDYVQPEQAPERTRDILGKLGNKNIFRMLAHSPSHFEFYVRLGGAIRYKGELDPELREIAITRTGILCKADYEVIAHKRLAKEAGVSDAKIAALEAGADSPAFTEIEKQVLRFTDDMVANDRASDATFDPLAKALTPGAMVELCLAVGFYILTSKFLRTFDVDLQD